MLSCRSSVFQSVPPPPKLLRTLRRIKHQSSIRHDRPVVLSYHLLSSVSSVHHDSDVHENFPDYDSSDRSTPKGWKIRGRLSEDLFHILNGEGRYMTFALPQPKEEEEVWTKDDRKNASVGPQQYHPTPEIHAPTPAASAAAGSTTLPHVLETNIPLQSRETAELLFDGIAPHLCRRDLLRLQTVLSKFNSARETRTGATCLISKINESFQNDTPWVCPLLSHFLVGRNWGGVAYCTTKTVKPQTFSSVSTETTEKHDATAMSKQRLQNFFKTLDELWSDPAFPPNSNRLTWDKDVKTLMRAQEKASHGPPLWCKRVENISAIEGNKFASATDTIVDSDTIIKNNMAAYKIHQAKSETVKRTEAEEVATLLADRLPRVRHERLMSLLNKWAPSPFLASSAEGVSLSTSSNNRNNNPSENQLPPKGTRIKFLETNLSHALGLHFPLVTRDLARFLYVCIPTSAQENDSPSNSITTSVNNETVLQESNTRLRDAWNEWNILRSSLVQKLMDCQLTYSQRLASPVKARRTKKDLCHDVIPKLTILRETVLSTASSRTDYVNVKDRLRSLQRSHFVFDALVLRDDLCKAVGEEYQSYENRLVFVRNLPIDITEGELRDIYSRCGPIETIEIFNLRPDLDPGRPSLKELLSRRQKNRRMLKREETNTPVYAKILFRDEEGYRVATDDNLVIFGVVIRKHPCRTIVKHEMRSLFLENFAPGQFSMDIEYKVSKALHPDIYVCLNVGYHDFTGIASCEIKFPSHEVAYYAYDRLQRMEDLGAQIQWLRTPSDARLHWTREISFESL